MKKIVWCVCIIIFLCNSLPVQATTNIIGFIDLITQEGTIQGWALDIDTPTQIPQVALYIDGPQESGTFIGNVTPDVPRHDISTAYPGYDGNYGYTFTLPNHYKDQHSHTLYAYGKDTANNQAKERLSNSPFSFQFGTADRIQISHNVSGAELTIGASTRFAGAIDSLIWNNKEFINNFDHGRELAYAWHLNGYGECENPTEPGSSSNGSGPSSTSILKNAVATNHILITQTQLAYWLSSGQTGFCENGATTAINTSPISQYILTKNVEIGYQNLTNVIRFLATIQVPEYARNFQIEAPTGYLTHEFNTYWTYNPQTDTITEVFKDPQNTVLPWSFAHIQSLPVIMSTADKQYAMGAYTSESSNYGLAEYKNADPAQATNKWNIISVRDPIFNGQTLTFESFITIGTLPQVTQALHSLYQLRPTDITPPEGFVETANCAQVTGWTWDPKAPNQSIDVKLSYEDDLSGMHVANQLSANAFRPDIQQAKGDNGLHGYNFTFPLYLKNKQTHNIKVYGVNTNSKFPDTLLRALNNFSLTCTPTITDVSLLLKRYTQKENVTSVDMFADGKINSLDFARLKLNL